MDYPRAFVFADSNTPLPPMENLQKWFRVKDPSNLYVQGVSSRDQDLEVAIETMTAILNYACEIEGGDFRCLVVSTAEISPLANLMLEQYWRGIAWTDSSRDYYWIDALACAIPMVDQFVSMLSQATNLHHRVASELGYIYEQAHIKQSIDLQEIKPQIDHAKNLINDQFLDAVRQMTKSGKRERGDLKNLDLSQMEA